MFDQRIAFQIKHCYCPQRGIEPCMFFDPTFVEGHKKNRKGTVELALRGQLDAGIQTSGICPVDVRQSKFASYDWKCIGSLEEGTPFAVRKWARHHLEPSATIPCGSFLFQRSPAPSTLRNDRPFTLGKPPCILVCCGRYLGAE